MQKKSLLHVLQKNLTSVFHFIVSAVYLAERINRFLGVRWKMFARQNYFDSHGLFISTLWSGPLLIILMIIVVSTYYLAVFGYLPSFSIIESNRISLLSFKSFLQLISGKHSSHLVQTYNPMEESRAKTSCQTYTEQGRLINQSGYSGMIVSFPNIFLLYLVDFCTCSIETDLKTLLNPFSFLLFLFSRDKFCKGRINE